MPNPPSLAVSNISLFDPSSSKSGKSLVIAVSDGDDFLYDASLGDSISINGTCLTITSLLPGKPDGPPSASDFKIPSPQERREKEVDLHQLPRSSDPATNVVSPHERDQKQAYKMFTVGVSPETLRRTNLGLLDDDSRVNLERACLPTTRLGGHFVQGHVDTIAIILSVTPDGEALTFRLRPRDREILRYVVEKGYVTLDGASLTVTKVVDQKGEEGGWFEIMLIDYTQGKVVMGNKKAGEEVNLEVDMVGKYVEKSVVGWLEGKGGGGGIEGMIHKLVEERMKTG